MSNVTKVENWIKKQTKPVTFAKIQAATKLDQGDLVHALRENIDSGKVKMVNRLAHAGSSKTAGYRYFDLAYAASESNTA